MKNLNVIAFLMLGGTLVTTSCTEEKTSEDVKQVKKVEKEVTHEEPQGIDVATLDIDTDIEYKVPTPNELFEVIKEANIQFDASVLNNINNISKYDNQKSQALNFGAYSADLAFIANNEVGTEALKYFKTIRQLSTELNVENAFDGTVFKRIEENISKDNQDSLLFLSNETYYKAFNYLEDNGREKILAYIVLGGWLESMSILTELGEYKEDGILAEKIGDQKLTLENIMGLMMSIDDEEIQETMGELAELEEVYMNLEQVEGGEAETTQQEDGKFMFSGGAQTVVSKEDFEKIKSLVADLRAQVIDASL
ncbi:MAG: hypothetical protein N4A35_16175 [Flavobacteriales bacterium]|nr:hypothetical protein [Flavobacteriales bacterium]